MMMNSFGKRNFRQRMGRPKMQSRCLDFFPLKFGAGGRKGGVRNFFHFFLVHNVCILCSL
jgi:hypothetical protein